ncbi:MAG: recombinase family protein [Peptococcaceae bacterium]|nr:recombinase family protein [Peptococcaceae bacterium]
MKIPAVAYCRVSTNNKDQHNSYEAQIRFFREKAEELGYQLVKGIGTFGDGIFADKGISGKSLNKRYEFLKMIEEAKNQDFQAILVTNASRFARNAVDGMDKIRELKRNNVYIHFLKESLKTCNHSDEFLIDFFLVFAQNELREMSKKIQDGIRKAQNIGKWTSTPPYGYDRIEGYLQVNPKEAEIVKLIFDMYVNQKISINRISAYLNDNKILSKTGKKWEPTTIRHMLTNPIYTGLQISHQVEMEDVLANIVKKTDKDERILKHIPELQIITEDIFEAAQMEKEYRQKLYENKSKFSSVNVLSNLFYCGNCGSAMKRMHRTDKKDLFFYVCYNRHAKGKAFCEHYNYIKEEDILSYIRNEIINFNKDEPFGTLEAMKEVYEFYVENYLGNDFINRLPEIEEQITKLENRKNNLIDILADGIITKEKFKERVKVIDEELEPLLRDKKKIDNINLEIEKVWKVYEQFCRIIKEFDPTNISNSELRKVIEKVTITTNGDNKKVQIYWNSGLSVDLGRLSMELADSKVADDYSAEDYHYHQIYEFDR